MGKHRNFTPDFKVQVGLEIFSGSRTAAQIGREHELKTALLATWKADITYIRLAREFIARLA